MPCSFLSAGLAAFARLHRSQSWFTGFAPCRKAKRRIDSGELSLQRTNFKRKWRHGAVVTAFSLVPLAFAGCSSNVMSTINGHETFTKGYVIDQQMLDQVPVGSSREQVLLALGTPSTTATFGNEVYYYISQKRSRRAEFQNLHIVSQNVLAIYFGDDDRVARLANYGLKDGKVFDFISRTTPTGGKETTFIGQMVRGLEGAPDLTQNGAMGLGHQ
ncbi:MAG: outer membrane protein assembly factor BamE [Rhizobiales bacterium]|nr:outer membrane protein assembly factor BamE [Hyphomicrobiales bacterium]